mmetsp:Transcript_16793/g.21798  ORF Transcript_16793/g.21798 Transcript_16793/m.21798 type:complete len:85 (-) Transcript_16793:149-403(-)
MNTPNETIVSFQTSLISSLNSYIDSLRGCIWRFIDTYLPDFVDEANAWWKWKICDYLLALFLLYLSRKVKSLRVQRVLDFMLEY